MFRSFSFRLAIYYAALFSLSVALVIGITYWARIAGPMEEIRGQVLVEARAYRALSDTRTQAQFARLLNQRARAKTGAMAFHALIAADGTIITTNLPSWASRSPEGLTQIEADRFIDGFEIDHTALVSDRTLPGGDRLIIGRDVEDAVRSRELLATASLWIFCSTIALGLIGGWMMSIAIGKRLDSVSRAAKQVMDGDLSGRIALRGSRDDFDRLNETLNLMLERIETLFLSMQRLSDHVAHELRTPLARLVSKLEGIERLAGDDDGALRLAVDEARVEAARLQQTFSALLRISRLEGDRGVVHLRQVDVVLLLEDLLELYQPEADRRGIALSMDARRPLVADMDVDLMFQAVSNLVDNALKHTHEGCSVVISATRRDRLEITVADDGPGLAAEEHERITEPFYRAPGSRGTTGDGLGMTMVAAIAHAHRANLTIADNGPGLRVTIAFPTDAPARVSD